MTRVNPLVLDGETLKLRLMAERLNTGAHVHIDWVRFTVPLGILPNAPEVETIFPDIPFCVFKKTYVSGTPEYNRRATIEALHNLQGQENGPYCSNFHAGDIAIKLASILGKDFSVSPEIGKGHDFYKHRISIKREGHECAWVGFGVAGDSPSKERQEKTVHVNIYGHACTFAEFGWREKLADLMDEYKAKVTRVDLALDFFDGLHRGVDGVLDDYRAGLCNVRGNVPKIQQIGDFVNNFGRSVYIGSREAGKITNIYEKGHQLFGKDSPSNWHRVEIRYGNKARVLPTDILRRPCDFFAGASDWHAQKLHDAQVSALPETIPVEKRLPLQTVQAEVFRSLRWIRNTAAKSVRTALHFMEIDQLFELLSPVGCASDSSEPPRPDRLSKFKASELLEAFGSQAKHFSKMPQFLSPSASMAFSI